MYRLLVIVDAQNDFITGSLGSKTADAAVPNIVSLIQNHEWDNIVCTMDTHGDDYFETLEGKNRLVPAGAWILEFLLLLVTSIIFTRKILLAVQIW